MEDFTRENFERNFHILQERMKADSITLSANIIRTTEGIQKVRKLPNGRIDFLSVDEMARCLVNTMGNFENYDFANEIKDKKE